MLDICIAPIDSMVGMVHLAYGLVSMMPWLLYYLFWQWWFNSRTMMVLIWIGNLSHIPVSTCIVLSFILSTRYGGESLWGFLCYKVLSCSCSKHLIRLAQFYLCNLTLTNSFGLEFLFSLIRSTLLFS